MLRLCALAALLPAVPALAQSAVELSFGGRVHADARAFPGGPEGEDPGFLLRRARVLAEAEVDGRFRASIETDFGEGGAELVDGYVEADLWPGVVFRVGQFKKPIGYESWRSSSDLRVAERALPTELSPRRGLGALAAWEGARAEAQLGLFNGVTDGASDASDWAAGPDAAARVFGYPLVAGPARLGVGLAVAAGLAEGPEDELPDYETSGDRVLFAYADGVVADGARVHLAPQATLDVGRLHVLGEWTQARHSLAGDGAGPVVVRHQAWHVETSYVLVGVPQGDDRPVPARALPEGGPGAIEVTARVHGLSLDPAAEPLAEAGSASGAFGVAAAVHWSPVAEARVGLTLERMALRAASDEAPRGETFAAVRAQIDL